MVRKKVANNRRHKMAHKYKQSREDREHEREGMERRGERREGREKGGEKDWVSGHDPKVGRSDFAGMPKEVHMRDFPKSRENAGGYLDDSITEIDDIQQGSEKMVKRHLSNQK